MPPLPPPPASYASDIYIFLGHLRIIGHWLITKTKTHCGREKKITQVCGHMTPRILRSRRKVYLAANKKRVAHVVAVSEWSFIICLVSCNRK